jgi:hypothetical protein
MSKCSSTVFGLVTEDSVANFNLYNIADNAQSQSGSLAGGLGHVERLERLGRRTWKDRRIWAAPAERSGDGAFGSPVSVGGQLTLPKTITANLEMHRSMPVPTHRSAQAEGSNGASVSPAQPVWKPALHPSDQ